MPTFSRADVAKHKTAETGIWVTFKDGVYDVTDFVDKHPGGNKILLAAGGAVDSFWVVYQQHAHSHVHEILAKYRIGSLDAKEAAAAQSAAAAVGDPYARDPPRSPFMHAHSAKPYNGEPPGQLLADHYITPVDLLFVRNHLPVPHIDPATHRLTVEVRRPGCEPETMSYSLADLQSRFPHGKVVSVITCSGNRRGDMAAAKEARGLSWAAGAIGNVEWTGVWLRDVLAHAGVREADLPAGAGPSSGSAGARAGAGGEGDAPSGWLRHVHFEGCDVDPAAGTNYAASIPADKALDPRADVLLAWALNGEPIPADHGAPLRAVVPGVTGARQVKWLGKVIADAEESNSLWQVKDYKLFPPTMDWNNVDFSSMPAMQEMPVQSAIAEPAPGAAIVADRDGTIGVKGWAWSGGGRGITRVDVSADGGKTWTVADITARPEDPTPSMSRSWGWTLWNAFVPVTPPATGAAAAGGAGAGAGEREVELVVKAVDAACNSQPESPLAIWNYRGLANNAWHRVPVKVKPAPPLPA